MITRPNPAGAELCGLIKSYDGHAIHLPAIQFGPPPDSQAFQRAIQSVFGQDWLIFISPQAVYASVAAIRSAWPQLPSQVKFAAVGAGTAKALEDAGYNVALCPGEWNSEGLLNQPELKSVQGKKIAIIRGVGGRELLTETLALRGAEITPLIAYQRLLPNIDVHPYLALLEKKKVDVVVCSSFEGVQNFKKLFASTGWSTIQQIPLIVVSERIKMLARNLDFQTIWVARNASHEAVLDLLAMKRKELCQMKS